MARRKRDVNLWWAIIRRKLSFRSSKQSSDHHDSNAVFVLHSNNGINFSQEFNTSTTGSQDNNVGSELLSTEAIAAVTIQAYFRRRLARRAYRALRSLVKLQAVVRGVIVRRQVRIALHCMHALARIQVTIKARQLLLNN